MLVDSHTHIHFRQFDADREDVISRSKQELEFIVEVGVNPETNLEALNLAIAHPNFIYPTMGLHPHDYTEKNLELVIQQFKEYNTDIVAIGEVGLDYYHFRDIETREFHLSIFKKLLDTTEKSTKPLIIHSRDSEKDCIDLLETYKIDTVILHCFSGSSQLADRAVDNGYYLGVPATIVNSKPKQDIVRVAGLSNLLLETDCPFLSPVQGTRNQPLNVKKSANTIVEILNITFAEVEEKTTQNAIKAFNINK